MQQALRRMVLDTLALVGTLDVTDRAALHASMNGVQRLLAVLGEPLPRLQALLAELHSAAATTRASVAAALYRELAGLAAARFGIVQALTQLDD